MKSGEFMLRCNDFGMKEKILKSYLYDRMIKSLKVIENKDYKNKLTEVVNSIELVDKGIKLRMKQTKENILYFEERKELFSKEEFKEIFKIKEKLDLRIERFEELEKERKEAIEEYIGEIKCENRYEGVSKLLQKDERYFTICLSLYEKYVHEIECKLAEIVFRKWENQLTDIPTYKDNSPFRFLVHAIDCNPEMAIRKAKSCNKISTSIITHKWAYTYQNRKYGFIYYPNNENVILADCGDFYADELLLGNEYPGISAEHISLKSYLNYSKVTACRTYLIEQLEGKFGDGYEKYNEVVLYNNEETNPKGVFVKRNSDEIYKKYAHELSEVMNLRLIEID